VNERVVQFRVGVMVLAALIVTAILILLFNEPRAFFKGTYQLRILFPQAPGVTKDTPVRKSGVLIGRVSEVDLVPDGGAMVVARIDGDRPLRRNEEFHIVSSLLGDAVVEVVPSRDPKALDTLLRSGDEISGIVRADPVEVISNLEGSLSNAIDSVAATSTELGKVIYRVGVLLENNEEQINEIISRAGLALDTIHRAAENANTLIGDPEMREQLRRAMAELPQMAEDAHQVISRMDQAVASVERNLRNVERLTEPLGERGELLATRIDRGVEKLDALLDEMLTFSRALNNPRSPLRQFLDDEELYPHVRQTVENIDHLTRRLRPIVEDARVAMDKIARDPGRLGVSGALRKEPRIK
jgi:phospholipid/cholesterol/gamma-HCH transport system substrate-binding protein